MSHLLPSSTTLIQFSNLVFASAMESGPVVFLEAVSKGKLHLARFILGATDGNLQVLNAMVSLLLLRFLLVFFLAFFQVGRTWVDSYGQT